MKGCRFKFCGRKVIILQLLGGYRITSYGAIIGLQLRLQKMLIFDVISVIRLRKIQIRLFFT